MSTMIMSMKRRASRDEAWVDTSSSKRQRWGYEPSAWAYAHMAQPPTDHATVIPQEDASTVVASNNIVRKPHSNDVLCGRGGHAIRHAGNIRFRLVVDYNKTLYQTCKKERKAFVAQSVVEAIYRQDPPGRFLELDKVTGEYKEIDKKKAIHKTSQALREGAKALREKLKSEGGNNNGTDDHPPNDDSDSDYSSKDSDDESVKDEKPYSQGGQGSSGNNNNSQQPHGRTHQAPITTLCATDTKPNVVPPLPELVYSKSWIPEGFTHFDETEASVVSVESILMNEPSFVPTAPQPLRSTSLDKFDFVPFEDAAYLDALLTEPVMTS